MLREKLVQGKRVSKPGSIPIWDKSCAPSEPVRAPARRISQTRGDRWLMIMVRKREGTVRWVTEAAVAKTMQQNAVSIQRMEAGKKTERMERPAAIRERKMKKSKGKSEA
jgi:hypothetical protein